MLIKLVLCDKMSLIASCRPLTWRLVRSNQYWKDGSRVLFSNSAINGAVNGLNGVRPTRNPEATKASVEDEKKEIAAETKVTTANSSSTTAASNLVKGHQIDHAVDLMSLRPGDRLDIPYELTVSETMQEFWHAAFYSQDRIHTSRPFCRNMGLQDRVIPFSLALFLVSILCCCYSFIKSMDASC